MEKKRKSRIYWFVKLWMLDFLIISAGFSLLFIAGDQTQNLYLVFAGSGLLSFVVAIITTRAYCWNKPGGA
jgi:predicted lysophospholipase L1 biosynthesis ABC-type transport system permease subunit